MTWYFWRYPMIRLSSLASRPAVAPRPEGGSPERRQIQPLHWPPADDGRKVAALHPLMTFPQQ